MPFAWRRNRSPPWFTAREKSQGGFFHGSLNTKLLISRHERFSASGAGFSFGSWPAVRGSALRRADRACVPQAPLDKKRCQDSFKKRVLTPFLPRGLARGPAEKAKSGLGTLVEQSGSATWRRGVSALLNRGLARDPAEKAKSGLGTLVEQSGSATWRRGVSALLNRGLAQIGRASWRERVFNRV